MIGFIATVIDCYQTSPLCLYSWIREFDMNRMSCAGVIQSDMMDVCLSDSDFVAEALVWVQILGFPFFFLRGADKILGNV